MSASQDAMNTLSAQWYNAIISGCGLSQDQFQLVQGNTPVGTTSEGLWNVFDSVPPQTATTFYDPSQLNSFHQDYAGIISALIPQGSQQFTKDMGSYYSQWNNYKKTISPLPQGNMAWSQAFSSWAQANLPQSLVTTCVGDYNTMLDDPIAVAANQLLEIQFAEKNKNIYAYTTTYEQLQTDLTSAPSKSVELNSNTESSDVSKSWAKAEASGIFDIFGLGGDSSTESLTVKITNSGVNIKANFDKLVTLAAGPLKSPSSDTYLQNFTPWFNSSALNEGYQKKDNTVWKAGDAISWESSFGNKGNLQRYASALVIVDGITISMTSNAALSTEEQSSFKAAMAGGVFPFFEAEGSGGWSNDVTFDDNGNVTVTSKCMAGNPQILGVLVSSIANILS